MKNDQIKLGGTYLAKVTDKVVPVRLDAENRHGGWDATNLVTNKKVRIKSAQRLRGPASDRSAKQRAKAVEKTQAKDAAANAHAVKPADVPDDVDQTVQAVAEGNLADGVTVPMPAKRKRVAGEAKPRKTSGLDAAYDVLRAKGEPMTCKAIVEEMLAKGMWTTNGKTPAATIYSAMLREIDTKPGESRFAKTGRGLFTATGK